MMYILLLLIFLFRKMEDLTTIQDARLKQFMIDSNDALEFRLIRSSEDLDSEEVAFKPEMSHQVFGSMYVVITFVLKICFEYKHFVLKIYTLYKSVNYLSYLLQGNYIWLS